MHKLKIGYISFAKTSFDMDLSAESRRKALGLLQKIDNVEVVDAGRLITLETEASEAVKMFKEKQVDAVVIHYCSFCLGAMTPAVVANLDLPVVLLATPEVNFEGDRVRSNSFCALNLNSFTLYSMKKKYRYIFKPLDDTTILQDFRVIFTALHTIKRLKSVRIGLIGSRSPGFYTSNFNELKLLNELGVTVEHIGISKVVQHAAKIGEEEVRSQSDALLQSIGNRSKVADSHRENMIRTGVAFANLSRDFSLDALAVKCWPELHADFGSTACASIGLMNSKIPTSAEGDVYGAVTMLMQRHITGEIPFFSDFIYSDADDNTGIFWHCGCGSMELAGDRSDIVLDNFPGKVKDAPERGCTMTFQIYRENARATVNQFGSDCDGNFRILNINGKNVKCDTLIRGNYCRLLFDNTVENVRKGILDNGFGHHYSLVLQDISEVIKEIAFWKDLKLYQL